ncbi:MAG TPA: LuxR C-terminal-related transcriptional regulator [Terriglobales bacterium]
MSPREQLNHVEVTIATLVWRGRTNPEIGALMGTSEQVVKNHLRSIFDKLGVWSRLELALYVASHGGHGWAQTLSMVRDETRAAAAAAGEVI